ncbi:MAG: hypothetical protein IT523_00955 [Burkholderiales bacterium]|nr:hypothetical protein [Burkholderiales bacterium]
MQQIAQTLVIVNDENVRCIAHHANIPDGVASRSRPYIPLQRSAPDGSVGSVAAQFRQHNIDRPEKPRETIMRATHIQPVRTMLATAASAFAFALTASTALAQVPPGMPPIGLPYGNYFAAVKAKLKLNAEQDAQYTAALKATVKANDAARRGRTAAAEAAKAELSKAEPDFERLLNMRDEFAERSASERKTAIREWVKFTQLLSVEQKSLIRAQLLERVTRAEALREQFAKRHGG